ncbi:MAG: transcriptional regulator [Nitriliruptorales bacterium]|nr:transcriptional regulator [Nitriliruptorales bacterium]
MWERTSISTPVGWSVTPRLVACNLPVTRAACSTTLLPMPAENSPLAAAVQKVGDRWSLLVIEALLGGGVRFNQLQEAIAGIATNVLSQRLKHLEHEGLIVAQRYSQKPPRSVYALTEAGQELADALRLLAAWGAEHGDDTESPAHTLCGTTLQTRWYCETCDTTVADTEADELRYA